MQLRNICLYPEKSGQIIYFKTKLQGPLSSLVLVSFVYPDKVELGEYRSRAGEGNLTEFIFDLII